MELVKIVLIANTASALPYWWSGFSTVRLWGL